MVHGAPFPMVRYIRCEMAVREMLWPDSFPQMRIPGTPGKGGFRSTHPAGGLKDQPAGTELDPKQAPHAKT
jgi:hypothetical protein